MTTSGLDLVRRYRELVSAGRLDEALGFLAEDLEFRAPDGSTFTYDDLKEMWSSGPPEYDHLTMETVATGLYEIDARRFLGESDHVFRWKESGEISNVEHRAMVFDVFAGKIRKMRFFIDPKDAWAEAGVERP